MLRDLLSWDLEVTKLSAKLEWKHSNGSSNVREAESVPWCWEHSCSACSPSQTSFPLPYFQFRRYLCCLKGHRSLQGLCNAGGPLLTQNNAGRCHHTFPGTAGPRSLSPSFLHHALGPLRGVGIFKHKVWFPRSLVMLLCPLLLAGGEEGVVVHIRNMMFCVSFVKLLI